MEIECFGFHFPPNPQGGIPKEVLKNRRLNVQYFQSVPPWGLGGKRKKIFHN